MNREERTTKYWRTLLREGLHPDDDLDDLHRDLHAMLNAWEIEVAALQATIKDMEDDVDEIYRQASYNGYFYEL